MPESAVSDTELFINHHSLSVWSATLTVAPNGHVSSVSAFVARSHPHFLHPDSGATCRNAGTQLRMARENHEQREVPMNSQSARRVANPRNATEPTPLQPRRYLSAFSEPQVVQVTTPEAPVPYSTFPTRS